MLAVTNILSASPGYLGKETDIEPQEDAAEAARNILYTLEGLKVSARAVGMTAERVDREIAYIMGTLGMVVK